MLIIIPVVMILKTGVTMFPIFQKLQSKKQLKITLNRNMQSYEKSFTLTSKFIAFKILYVHKMALIFHTRLLLLFSTLRNSK